jgi:diguanylate cyclase (GGDEF)-like protein
MLAKDDLTGVYDRSIILERLDAAARESGSLSVVFMDLDNLMRFNDQYGFQAGDEWIKGVVNLFTEAFGTDDLVGRYGGDEFIAGVRSMSLNSIFEKAEQLRQKIETDGPSITINGQPTRTGDTAAFGLANYPNNASDTFDLVEKAKLALYRAKEAGGNRVCSYEEKDSLTGLLNYYGGQRALTEALDTAQEKHQVLSVILFDIDCFKELNDEFGHRAGDEVIKRLARILSGHFMFHGISSRLSRTGGDEFAVVLPGQHADSAFVLAEEVRKQVEESEIKVAFGEQNLVLRFHVTGGIASYPSDGNERVDLLRKAGEALYRAKQTGRNRICLPASSQMITKTSHYTQIQLERLTAVAKKLDKSEAFLLREALDDLLRKYGDEGNN